MNALIRRICEGFAFRFESCIRNPLRGFIYVVCWHRRALTVHSSNGDALVSGYLSRAGLGDFVYGCVWRILQDPCSGHGLRLRGTLPWLRRLGRADASYLLYYISWAILMWRAVRRGARPGAEAVG